MIIYHPIRNFIPCLPKVHYTGLTLLKRILKGSCERWIEMKENKQNTKKGVCKKKTLLEKKTLLVPSNHLLLQYFLTSILSIYFILFYYCYYFIFIFLV